MDVDLNASWRQEENKRLSRQRRKLLAQIDEKAAQLRAQVAEVVEGEVSKACAAEGYPRRRRIADALEKKGIPDQAHGLLLDRMDLTGEDDPLCRLLLEIAPPENYSKRSPNLQLQWRKAVCLDAGLFSAGGLRRERAGG